MFLKKLSKKETANKAGFFYPAYLVLVAQQDRAQNS